MEALRAGSVVLMYEEALRARSVVLMREEASSPGEPSVDSLASDDKSLSGFFS